MCRVCDEYKLASRGQCPESLLTLAEIFFKPYYKHQMHKFIADTYFKLNYMEFI